MANGWEDEGTLGSASRVPTNEWFPINTATGAWDLPGQPATLARTAGLPDVNAAPVWGGTPDQAPLAIGQVAGTMAPQLGPQPRLAQVARMSEQGMLAPQPSVWESIARGIGMASPLGRSYLQATDQQQQQQLTNRMALRRQQLLEEQEARQGVKDEYSTLVAISQIKNKALRNMQFDRFAARAAEAGTALPPDFIAAYKKSSLAEGEGIAQAYGPLLEKAGFSPTQTASILEAGDLDTIKGLLEGGLKVKKAGQEEEEAKALQRIQAGGTLADVSGVQAPAPASTTGTPAQAPTTPAPTARAGPVPPDIDTAVTEATKLYPQVRQALVHGIIRHESNYDALAVSPKGATGAMQLMPGTAKDMGVDNPKDPVQNVRGGTRYFAQMLTKYHGNEALALAAYNWGPGNVDKVNGDLTKMPAETQAYVKNVLASAAGEQRGPAGTQGQVAGPGAPAPTTPAPSAADSAALTRLKQAIAAKQQQIQQLSGLSSERANKVADNMRADLKILQDQHDRLEDRLTKAQERGEEISLAVKKQEALLPGQKELAEAAKALTPIDRMTQQSLATNKSVYRSIGKIEEYLREGTDLPADFVNLVAQDTPGISAWLQADPKNITGLAKQWETKFKAVAENDPRANRFLAALGNMRDLIIRERSGGSVTGNELDRAMGAFMGSLPNINQAFSLFAQNLANAKEMVIDELVTAGAAARPLSGGKAMYGTLPKEIRDRIDYAERGEEYPKARMPATTTQPRPQVTGPIKQVAP